MGGRWQTQRHFGAISLDVSALPLLAREVQVEAGSWTSFDSDSSGGRVRVHLLADRWLSFPSGHHNGVRTYIRYQDGCWHLDCDQRSRNWPFDLVAQIAATYTGGASSPA
jgi:hypothetical protein